MSLGDGPGPLHRTWGVDAHEVQPLADVLVTGQACWALAAPLERHDGHRITDRPGRHALAYVRDATGHLVPEDRWQLHALVHVAVQDVQVSAADPGEGDLDPHLSRAGSDHDRPGSTSIRRSPR